MQIQAANRLLASSLEDRAYDFFRNNFGSVKDLQKNGMKGLEEHSKIKNERYYRIKPEDLKNPAIKHAFNRAVQNMATEEDY